MKDELLINDAKKFLSKHLPGSISDGCNENLIDNLPPNFINTLYNTELIKDLNLEVNTFDIESLFPRNLDKEKIRDYDEPDSIFGRAEYEGFPIFNLIANFGKDAFGLYLPFHYYNQCWGVYLFKEIIESRVMTLYSLFNRKISLRELNQLYYYAIYRHELFHYQVERFATKVELITKKQVYRPSRILFQQVMNSENWLEEALAENAVTKSKLVSVRTNIKSSLLREIYERDLQDMPPGYKDYKCLKFGGPEKAHRLFASQIIESMISPSITITDLFSVKNEFIAIDKKVPTYLVSGFKNIKRIKM